MEDKNLETVVQDEVMNPADSEFIKKNMTSLFWKYTLFAMAGLVAQMIGTVGDGLNIGNGIGEMGLAAIGVIASMMTFTVGFFLMFAIGSSTLAGIKLGNGELEEAKNVYGSILIFGAIVSVIIAILGLLFLNPLLHALGATDTILPYARAYAIPFFIGWPFVIVGQTVYSFTRLAERPLLASLFYIIPCLGGVVLEWFMIFVMHTGIVAGGVYYAVGCGIPFFLIPFLQAKNSPFRLKKENLKLRMDLVGHSLKIGFPMFIINAATMVETIVINHQLIAQGGNDLHIAAFGIFNAYIVYVLTIFTNSFITGMQPIVSVNLGAKRYDRIRQVIKTGIIQGSICIIGIMIIVILLAAPIVSAFAGGYQELIDLTVHAMRIFIFLYAFGNVSQLVAGYFIAAEKNGMAILNALARGIIFAVPLLYILPAIVGNVDGVWMAQPGADLLAGILALICIVHEYKVLGKKESVLDV